MCLYKYIYIYFNQWKKPKKAASFFFYFFSKHLCLKYFFKVPEVLRQNFELLLA